ncbi:MAG: hypothetical protein GOU99_02635 [Candidatus Altiarchaeota archaeon]|nr:hypothetical protein [Candidatus Altiarchaeota archaeon]
MGEEHAVIEVITLTLFERIPCIGQYSELEPLDSEAPIPREKLPLIGGIDKSKVTGEFKEIYDVLNNKKFDEVQLHRDGFVMRYEDDCMVFKITQPFVTITGQDAFEIGFELEEIFDRPNDFEEYFKKRFPDVEVPRFEVNAITEQTQDLVGTLKKVSHLIESPGEPYFAFQARWPDCLSPFFDLSGILYSRQKELVKTDEDKKAQYRVTEENLMLLRSEGTKQQYQEVLKDVTKICELKEQPRFAKLEVFRHDVHRKYSVFVTPEKTYLESKPISVTSSATSPF